MKERWKLFLLFGMELAIGILLLINPIGFTKGIILALGIVLLIMGMIQIIRYFGTDAQQAILRRSLVFGILECILGLLCILQSQWLMHIFPMLTVLYGLAVLLDGLMKLQWAVDLIRLKCKGWGWLALSSGLTILFAIIAIINPFETTVLLWKFLGITLLAEAVADLIILLFGKPLWVQE